MSKEKGAHISLIALVQDMGDGWNNRPVSTVVDKLIGSLILLWEMYRVETLGVRDQFRVY